MCFEARPLISFWARSSLCFVARRVPRVAVKVEFRQCGPQLPFSGAAIGNACKRTTSVVDADTT